MLCAEIDKEMYMGPNVTFCSPQKDLQRAREKGLPCLLLYVPLLTAAEMLAMKAKLPQYQVRGTDHILLSDSAVVMSKW